MISRKAIALSPASTLAMALAIGLVQSLFPVPATAAAPVSAHGDWLIRRWASDQGLPQNQVRAIAQTPDGYLWIGSFVGLARFDGAQFTRFTLADTPALGDDCINALAVDRDGTLWIGTKDGLVQWNRGVVKRWTKSDGLPGHGKQSIYQLLPHPDGGIWWRQHTRIGRLKDGRITTLGFGHNLHTNEILRISTTAQGGLIAESWVGYQRLERGSEQFAPLVRWPAPDVNWTLVEDRSGTVWAGFTGLWKQETNAWVHPVMADSINGKIVRNVFADRGGVLWLTTVEGGLQRLENGRFEALAFDAQRGRTSVSAFFEDREGTLWIGTAGAGLYRLRRRLSRSWTTEDGLPSNEVRSIAIGPDDSVWLATKSGVARIRGRVELLEDPIGNNGPNVLAVTRDGTVWVEGNGVRGFRMVGQQEVMVHRETNASGNAFLIDRRGQLWLAGRELAVLAAGHFERRIGKDMLEAKVCSMLEDRAGALWFGTLGAGLKRFKDGRLVTFKTSDGLPDDSPLALLEDSDGAVWIGFSKGLARYRNGQFATVSTREGLPEDIISQLLDDRTENLWWGGLRGIYCARRTDLNAVADGQTNRLNCLVYGEADGLAASETAGERQPTAGRTSDGRLWFAMEYGVGEIDPKKLLAAEVPPNVLVERVAANDKLVWSDGRAVLTEGTTAGLEVVSSAPVQLGKGQGGVVEIHYTATCLSGADRVRFRYRLDGHDTGWHEAGGSRVALYTNLRPGQYMFRVMACNEHGLWGDAGASLGVVLAPKLTETKLFFVLCGAGAIAAVAAVQGIRLRTQRRILRLEHQREKERERTRLARDLHDELGTALTGLALEMDVVRRRADEPAGIAPRLARMADDARSLAERMREVVWAISPRSDDVPGVAVFLEQHATAFIESAGLECHLEYPEQIPPLPLASSVRHQLALGVREALTNVVRHARARKVTLQLRIEGQILVVVVHDDGIGFEPKQRSEGGNGLTSIENRLAEVGGTVVTDSRPGQGTSVRFQVPLIPTPHP